MKNRHGLNLSTSLVAALFILSLFAGVAAADSPREQYEKYKQQFEMHKQKYIRTKEKFEDAKQTFEKALNNYRNRKTSISRDDLKLKFKDYLVKTADHLTSRLETLKYRAERYENKGIVPFNASDNIDKYKTELEQIKTNAQQANSAQKLVNSNRELRNLWNRIRLEVRYYIGILVNHRIDRFLDKTDNVSERMNMVMQRLKDQGKDVTKLEQAASDFNRLVDKAKTDHQRILELYAAHEGFDSDGTVTDIKEAEAFIRESGRAQRDNIMELKGAARHLREFFREAKRLSSGKVVVRGTGTLEASGTGRAVISGNVTVNVSGNGTLIVSGNANVTTKGNGTKEVLGSGAVKYQGFGSAAITGEDIKIAISGNDITLKAEGTGSAVLRGNGTYRTEKDFAVSGEWQKEE